MKSFFIPEVQTPHQSSRVHFLIFHRLLGLAARDLGHCYLQPSLIIFTANKQVPVFDSKSANYPPNYHLHFTFGILF